MIEVYAKIQLSSLKYLSKPSSFALWTNWLVYTATPIFLTLFVLEFFLHVVHPTKPLCPEVWTHWDIFWCMQWWPLFSVQIWFFQKLVLWIFALAKITLSFSLASKEIMIWKFLSPEQPSGCPWHFVEQLECVNCFDMTFALHWKLAHPAVSACPLALPWPPSLTCRAPWAEETPGTSWHFVEHHPCTPGARAERACCTCLRPRPHVSG